MGLHKGKYQGVLSRLCLMMCHILVMFEGKKMKHIAINRVKIHSPKCLIAQLGALDWKTILG